jgi:hypothetical protein
MAARARIRAKDRADVRLATTVARAKTPVKARVGAKPQRTAVKERTAVRQGVQFERQYETRLRNADKTSIFI